MLSKILSREECASCKFCCSFRKQSLWETPIFNEEIKQKIDKLYPDVKFREIKTLEGKSRYYTIDLFDSYKTDNPEEEVKCPFLEDGKGCILSAELKPFDCSIWPLRVMKKPQSEKNILSLTPTCQAINKIPFEKLKSFVNDELRIKILEYAKNNPEIIKEYKEGFPVF